MQSIPNISYLTDIYFGYGTLATLPGLLKKYSINRPLVVTDKGVVTAGIIDRLGINASVVFDAVETNPTEAMALAALEVYIRSECDGIIAAGGGSPIDLAKCVALLVHHQPPLKQYAMVNGGISKITSYFPLLIAVPTTAGSGSEIGRAALLTLSNGKKLALISQYLLPKAAICDPELTIGMPPKLTAATGMDAISHCIEALCSIRYNPVADAIAIDGLERGYNNIIKATLNGNDREARSEMMLCSLQGGLAFQKSLGAVHSLSHPLGALTKKRLHHGTLNAILLPFVLKFNYNYCKEKMEMIAARLKIKDAYKLPYKFALLNEELGLPVRLREMGLTKTELSPLAKKAKEDHCTPTNPRPLEVEDCKRLYAEAW
jgi:4-hydroxybutyrate dehydrogenase